MKMQIKTTLRYHLYQDWEKLDVWTYQVSAWIENNYPHPLLVGVNDTCIWEEFGIIY